MPGPLLPSLTPLPTPTHPTPPHPTPPPSHPQIFDSDDLDDDIQQKVEEFEAATSVPCLHTVAFY